MDPSVTIFDDELTKNNITTKSSKDTVKKVFSLLLQVAYSFVIFSSYLLMQFIILGGSTSPIALLVPITAAAVLINIQKKIRSKKTKVFSALRNLFYFGAALPVSLISLYSTLLFSDEEAFTVARVIPGVCFMIIIIIFGYSKMKADLDSDDE